MLLLLAGVVQLIMGIVVIVYMIKALNEVHTYVLCAHGSCAQDRNL